MERANLVKAIASIQKDTCVTVLQAKALIHHTWPDMYGAGEHLTEQCSTCQIWGFRDVLRFSKFHKDLLEVMRPYRTGVCVIWNYWYFRLLKLWFWRWSVQRVCFTGGGGTLWVIKKRPWIL